MSKKKILGPLLPNDIDVLRHLREFIGKHMYSPTYTEICGDLGFTSNVTVARALDRLEDRGFIKRPVQQKRSIMITDAGKALKLPEKVG